MRYQRYNPPTKPNRLPQRHGANFNLSPNTAPMASRTPHSTALPSPRRATKHFRKVQELTLCQKGIKTVSQLRLEADFKTLSREPDITPPPGKSQGLDLSHLGIQMVAQCSLKPHPRKITQGGRCLPHSLLAKCRARFPSPRSSHDGSAQPQSLKAHLKLLLSNRKVDSSPIPTSE